MPAVSVVIPTHDRPALVRRAVDSVLAQEFDDLECIVVDDGSDEDIQGALAAVDDNRYTVLEHETSRGASAARNTGIEWATGEYVGFLDDDDEWLPTKLSRQVERFETGGKNLGLVYCWWESYDSGGAVVSVGQPEYRGDIFLDVIDDQRIGNASTLLLRRAVIDEVGGFDADLPRGNDGDFIRRVCRAFETDYVPERLVRRYLDHGSERITRYDESGHRNAIRGQKVKFEKFGDTLERHPRKTAAIHSHIGYHAAMVGEWRLSATHFLQAVRTAPTSERAPLQLARAVKHHLGGRAP